MHYYCIIYNRHRPLQAPERKEYWLATPLPQNDTEIALLLSQRDNNDITILSLKEISREDYEAGIRAI